MIKQICWLNGTWSSEEELLIPLLSKGIILGNGIFETILILKGQPKLLKNHLSRWHKSAKLLSMHQPPDEYFLMPLIKEALKRVELINQNGVLRLYWCRKNFTGQSININDSDSSDYYFWLELTSRQPYFTTISTIISRKEYRNANSLVSTCKSFSYIQSILARQEAKIAGCDEALLLSTNGMVCCGTTSNLIVKRNHEWLTPSTKTGCLPGIMRQQGLEKGIIHEAEIDSTPQAGDQWLLINSLSCQPINRVNNISLNIYPNPEIFWQSLLEDREKSFYLAKKELA